MKKYLLLDRRFLNPQALENVCMEVTPPEKDRVNNPLFIQDRPWEVRIDNGYPNVIYDKRAQLFRCYYTLFTDDLDTEGTSLEERSTRDYIPRMDRVTSLAYAESTDGIHWHKPELNRVEWRGNKLNNLLFLFAHGTWVMLDEHDPCSAKRYKMVTKVDISGNGAYMAVAFSPDGRDWSELIPWPEFNPQADSHNYPFWCEEEYCYMLMSRVWKDGIRITTLSRSQDFIHWSEPTEALRGRGYGAQVYSMPVFRWGDIYLGLASLIHEGDRQEADFDTVDCELTWAVNPNHFDFVAPQQPVIPRGNGHYPDGDADCACIYASAPVKMDDGTLWLYYMGGNGLHTNFRETSLMRAKWVSDRFAAMEPRRAQEVSILTTCRLAFSGGSLEVLAEPICKNEPVMLQAQIQDVWTHEPIQDFSYEDSFISEEKEGWHRIQWGKGLENLNISKGCIKFRFKNLKVWAVQGDICLDGHRLWEGADMENERVNNYSK